MASASDGCSQNEDVLRSLLHLVSQPLTTLHCALESSLGQDGKSQLHDIAVALEETDRVIEAVRLMREYLDADEKRPLAAPSRDRQYAKR
jgi:hypothetical protein